MFIFPFVYDFVLCPSAYSSHLIFVTIAAIHCNRPTLKYYKSKPSKLALSCLGGKNGREKKNELHSFRGVSQTCSHDAVRELQFISFVSITWQLETLNKLLHQIRLQTHKALGIKVHLNSTNGKTNHVSWYKMLQDYQKMAMEEIMHSKFIFRDYWVLL